MTKSLFLENERVRAPRWLVSDVMRVLMIRVRTDRKGICVASVASICGCAKKSA